MVELEHVAINVIICTDMWCPSVTVFSDWEGNKYFRRLDDAQAGKLTRIFTHVSLGKDLSRASFCRCSRTIQQQAISTRSW